MSASKLTQAAQLRTVLQTGAGKQVREACRKGLWKQCTSGLASGYGQGNLVVLSVTDAYDFIVYCVRNPKPCPLLDISDPGCYELPNLGEDIDIRTDIPKYIVHTPEKDIEMDSIKEYWKNNSVAIIGGCSFTFESALHKSGIGLRHVEESVNVPMYITNVPTVRSGRFQGPLVVSMRPVKNNLVEQAKAITRAYPESHGSPVHSGDPKEIGIMDLQKPDFGDAVTVRPDEVPVFWACGVTAQVALQNASLEQWITHAPGHMLLTDLQEQAQ